MIFGTHMLEREADDWWVDNLQRLEGTCEAITWDLFHREFLVKYYLEHVRGKKENEYLELKQGDLMVTVYAAKFMELENFYPHYTEETTEFSKCNKFENGLHTEIKKAIGYQRIRKFLKFSKCWIKISQPHGLISLNPKTFWKSTLIDKVVEFINPYNFHVESFL